MDFSKSLTEKEKRSAQVAILTGFILIAFFTKAWWLVAGCGFIGIVFLFSESLSNLILKGWFFLAFLLGWVNSRILLSLVFFLVLLPLALLSRVKRSDPLHLKWKSELETLFKTRNHTFTKSDFEKQW